VNNIIDYIHKLFLYSCGIFKYNYNNYNNALYGLNNDSEFTLLDVNPYIDNYHQLCIAAIKKDKKLIKSVPRDNKLISDDDYYNICLEYTKKYSDILKYNHIIAHCTNINTSNIIIESNQKYLTLCKKSIELKPNILQKISNIHITNKDYEYLCDIAFQKHGYVNSIPYVNNNYIKEDLLQEIKKEYYQEILDKLKYRNSWEIIKDIDPDYLEIKDYIMLCFQSMQKNMLAAKFIKNKAINSEYTNNHFKELICLYKICILASELQLDIQNIKKYKKMRTLINDASNDKINNKILHYIIIKKDILYNKIIYLKPMHPQKILDYFEMHKIEKQFFDSWENYTKQTGRTISDYFGAKYLSEPKNDLVKYY
jgi:hypothetical protein